MAKKKSDSEKKDIRVEATKVIWGMSAALFGMGIPITAISGGNEPIVPVLTIIMAMLSTVGVWAFGHRIRPTSSNPNELTDLNETIMALKNSVSMLEDTLGDELLRRRIENEAPNGFVMQQAPANKQAAAQAKNQATPLPEHRNQPQGTQQAGAPNHHYSRVPHEKQSDDR